jgi:hypothetical protein
MCEIVILHTYEMHSVFYGKWGVTVVGDQGVGIQFA